MSRLTDEKNKKENKLMTFTVGNEEVKLSPAIVKNYLVNGQADKLTDQEIVYFMHLCKARKLNPFTKEVYLIKYGNQPATMVVSRDGWARIINDNPLTDDIQFEQDEESCTCKIYRKDRSHPTVVTEF